MDIINLSDRFFLDQALVLVPVLLFFGFLLKSTPKVPNWLIPWLLLVLGILGGILVVGFTITGVLQGILATSITVFSHQLYKQTKNRMY